jgi:hypothetical protein
MEVTKMWRDKYNEWKNNHDFTKYKNRDEIDEVIVNKLSTMSDEMETMLDEMKNQFTSDNSESMTCCFCCRHKYTHLSLTVCPKCNRTIK